MLLVLVMPIDGQVGLGWRVRLLGREWSRQVRLLRGLLGVLLWHVMVLQMQVITLRT